MYNTYNHHLLDLLNIVLVDLYQDLEVPVNNVKR